MHDNLVELLGATLLERAEHRCDAAGHYHDAGLARLGQNDNVGQAGKLKEVDRRRFCWLLWTYGVRRRRKEQLAVLGTQIGVASLPIVAGQDPLAITKRALETARLEGYDVLILDTAGRLAIDDELMAEAAAISALAQPHEKLLVVDAMTGQDAVTTAKAFEERSVFPVWC